MGHLKERIGIAVVGGIFQILVYACIILALIWVGKYTYHFGYEVFSQQPISPDAGESVIVVVGENDDAYDIGKILEAKGLIDDARVFWVQEKISVYKDKLQPGTYELSTAYSPNRIMEEMSKTAMEQDDNAEEEGSES